MFTWPLFFRNTSGAAVAAESAPTADNCSSLFAGSFFSAESNKVAAVADTRSFAQPVIRRLGYCRHLPVAVDQPSIHPHLPDPSDRHFYRDLNQLLAGIAMACCWFFSLPLFRLPYIGRYFILLMWLSPAYPMAVTCLLCLSL
jgi:hypothetical protein